MRLISFLLWAGSLFAGVAGLGVLRASEPAPLAVGRNFEHQVFREALARPTQPWSHAALPPDTLSWTSGQRAMPVTGFSTGYQWFLIRIALEDTAARSLLLEIGNAHLAEVRVFIRRTDRIDSFAAAGSRTAFQDRVLPYRLPAFPIECSTREAVEVYLRVRGDGTNRTIPIELWDRGRWEADCRTRLTFFSAFFTVMTTIAIVGLVISLVIAIPFRWPWLAFTLSGTALAAVYTGLANALIWPGSAFLQSAALPFLTNSTLLAGTALLQALYRTREHYPRLNRALNLLRFFLLGGMVFALVVPFVNSTTRTILFCAGESVFLLGTVLVLVTVSTFIATQRRGEPVIMMIALAPQAAAIALHAVQNLGFVRFPFSLHILDWIGAINVTLLLSLILLRRIRLLINEGFREFSQAILRRRQNTFALLQRESAVRRDIGQDIDQRLGPLMLSVQQGLTGFDPPLQDLLQQLSAARAEIRGICDNRIPSNLTERGLINAISEIIQPLEAAGTRVNCVYQRPKRLEKLDLLYQLVLFRIAQGLLNNVYKHAQASQVEFSLHVERGSVLLDLKDNGIGFDPGFAGGGGKGLAIIRQRVETLGGSFQLQSRPGGGSHFRIEIPLKF